MKCVAALGEKGVKKVMWELLLQEGNKDLAGG